MEKNSDLDGLWQGENGTELGEDVVAVVVSGGEVDDGEQGG